MLDRFWDKENRYTKGVLKVYQYWSLEVSYRQHTLGCYILFARRRVERFSELDNEELNELKIVMGEIEKALSASFQPDRYNYLQLGNVVHQLHLHGIPRYKEKRKFAEKNWVDSSWGDVPHWDHKDVSHELVAAIRNNIKPYLY